MMISASVSWPAVMLEIAARSKVMIPVAACVVKSKAFGQLSE
jgi:hypothetical protein